MEQVVREICDTNIFNYKVYKVQKLA